MSVVIVGGHERMECKYKEICKSYGIKAKVFTKMTSSFKKQIGSPDLIVLFTNTVSHKMVGSALKEANRVNCIVERCHNSSANALVQALECHYCKHKKTCKNKKSLTRKNNKRTQ